MPLALDGPIVLGSLLMALITVAFAIASIESLDVRKPLGPPNWDFAKSWASTFAVLAAVISPIASGNKNFVSEPALFLPKVASYGALSLAFGLIVVLGPFLYRAWSEPRVVAGKEVEYQGKTGWYLVASGMTLWGTLGQLITVVVMIFEAQPAAIATHNVFLLLIPFAVSTIALFRYVYTAIEATVRSYERIVAVDSTASPPGWSVL